MSLSNFYYSPEILNYDFGPQHPLKPERLRRTIELLDRFGVVPIDPGPGAVDDVLRVHDESYVRAVQEFSQGDSTQDAHAFGFGKGDNPIFPGMFRASLAYTSATAAAARAVCSGAPIAYAIGGGLHHAHRNRASGFCIFDDPAIACDILLEQFARIAYVDIDVHHGDGVQWMFYDNPRVLTCSIHEEGRTLFPGSGGVEEVGVEYTSFNVPLQAKTSSDVWLSTFLRSIPAAIEAFRPQAIVLQMGTDSHFLDPLGHIRCTQQDWLAAVIEVKRWGLPTVAIGGGGYNLATVPRMWSSACLTLGGIEYDNAIPKDLAIAWQMPSFSDSVEFEPNIGLGYADQVVKWLKEQHIAHLKGI